MIHKSTGYKVHVNNLIYKIYDKLPAIQSALTIDPYETPVHCCIYENRKRDLAKTDLMSKSCLNAVCGGSGSSSQEAGKNARKDFGINAQSKYGGVNRKKKFFLTFTRNFYRTILFVCFVLFFFKQLQ